MLSIILPTYKEAKNIAELIPQIDQQLKGVKYEIIVVDDNSPDGTAKEAQRLAENGYPISILIRYKERGLASATVRGFTEAKYDLIAVMDSDLQHNPKYIPRMIKTLKDNHCDIVIGSRYLKDSAFDNWSPWRKLLSKSGLMLTKPLTKVKDPLTQFYIVRKDILSEIPFIKSGYRISLQILAMGKISKVAEIPIRFHDRKYGKSTISIKGTLRDLWAVTRLYIRKLFNIRKIKYLYL